MADVFAGKAVAFIEQQRAKAFFLFFAMHDTARATSAASRASSARATLGPRGDAIVQADWCVG